VVIAGGHIFRDGKGWISDSADLLKMSFEQASGACDS